jgi:hypothetical protein
VCKFEPIIDAYSKEKVEKQRKVLELALEALENSSDLVFKDVKKSHLRGLAIATIQGVLKP